MINSIKYSKNSYCLYIARCYPMTACCVAKNMNNAKNTLNSKLRKFVTSAELNKAIYSEHETVRNAKNYLRR